MAIKHMDIREFMEEGYLQEANRQFFHTLGLALETEEQDDGTWILSGIWDYRDDEEGIIYDCLDKAKSIKVVLEQADKARSRQEKFGFAIQPLEEIDE